MTTTDQVIDDVIGEMIADVQNAVWDGDNLAGLENMVDRLVNVRTQLRNGRGDDWMGVADPIESLAIAGYRAEAILVKEFTPPMWSFVDEDIRTSWRRWAKGIIADM